MSGGDVYYAVRNFPAYGKLSRRNLDDLRAGASDRLAEGAADVKKDPLRSTCCPLMVAPPAT